MNSAIWRIASPDSDLRRFRAHAAMCAFRIDKLCEHPTEVLLLGRHAEQYALGAHIPIERLDISDSETQFHFACRIFVRSRVQRESSFARHELTPLRRFEFQCQTEHIAMELHSFVHVGDELNHIPKLCSLHCSLLWMNDTATHAKRVVLLGQFLSQLCLR